MTDAVVFGVLVLLGLYLISSALDRIHRTLTQAAEQIREIADAVESISRDVGPIPEACVEVRRLRSHIVGATAGETAKALDDWDRQHGA